MKSKTWFDVKAGQHDLTLSVHDEIGTFGIGHREFVAEFKDKKVDQINVSIHSRGGNMLDALGIFYELKQHPARVHTNVSGFAASAATLILMAGDHITMPEDAWMMIHNPWAAAAGDGDFMRDLADQLDTFQGSMMHIYQSVTGMPDDEIKAIMDAETWLDGQAALEKKFIHATTDAMGVAALAQEDAKHFAHLPAALAASISNVDLERITDPRSFEAALRDAGVSKAAAQALTAKAKTLSGVRDSHNDLSLLHSLQSLSFS